MEASYIILVLVVPSVNNYISFTIYWDYEDATSHIDFEFQKAFYYFIIFGIVKVINLLITMFIKNLMHYFNLTNCYIVNLLDCFDSFNLINLLVNIILKSYLFGVFSIVCVFDSEIQNRLSIMMEFNH